MPSQAAQNSELAETLIRQGNDLEDGGKLNEAREKYLQASKIIPDSPKAFLNLGNVALAMGEMRAAINNYQTAIDVKPDHASSHYNLGRALGIIGQHEKAIASLERALHLSPDFADAWVCLGNENEELGRQEEAEPCFLKAIEIRPDYPEVHFSLARNTYNRALFEESILHARHAIALRETYASGHNILGDALREIFQFREAITHLERALELDPASNSARYGLGFALLSIGDLENGWKMYDSRFDADQATRIEIPDHMRDWDGLPHPEKTLLVWAEQGIGDELMFSSIFSEIPAYFHSVTATCDQRLIPIFQRSYPNIRFFSRTGDLSPLFSADYHIAIGSLGRHLRPNMPSFERNAESHLKADADLTQKWREWLSGLDDGFKVGICWRSGMQSSLRNRFYSSLAEWESIFKVPGVQFINLQYGEVENELEQAEAQYGITIHRPPNLDLKNDIDSVASLMEALGIVISAGTAVFALSAALGKETWSFTVERPWDMLGTDDYPWFPSARIYKKEMSADWQVAFKQIASDLSDRANTTSR